MNKKGQSLMIAASILGIIAIIFLLFIAAKSAGLFNIAGGDYVQHGVWQGHNVTFHSLYPYGQAEIIRYTSTTAYFSYSTVKADNNALSLDLTSSHVGALNVNSFSNSLCVSFDDIDLSRVSQLHFIGTTNLDTQGYRGSFIPASFKILANDKIIYQTSVSTGASQEATTGSAYQNSGKSIPDIIITLKDNRYYVTDALGNVLAFPDRTATGSETLKMCIGAGQQFLATSKASISFTGLQVSGSQNTPIQIIPAPNDSSSSSSTGGATTPDAGHWYDGILNFFANLFKF